MPDDKPGRPVDRNTVVPLELFFDLVFVSAFTQVTTLLRSDPTWGGVLALASSSAWCGGRGPPTPG
jgi:low temperature requirement protein LtrA